MYLGVVKSWTVYTIWRKWSRKIGHALQFTYFMSRNSNIWNIREEKKVKMRFLFSFFRLASVQFISRKRVLEMTWKKKIYQIFLPSRTRILLSKSKIQRNRESRRYLIKHSPVYHRSTRKENNKPLKIFPLPSPLYLETTFDISRRTRRQNLLRFPSRLALNTSSPVISNTARSSTGGRVCQIVDPR